MTQYANKLFFKAMLLGIVAAMAAYLVLPMILARMILAGALAAEHIPIYLGICACIAELFGGGVSIYLYKKRALLLTIIQAVVVFVLMIVLGMLIYEKSAIGNNGLFVFLGLIIGSLVTGLFGITGKKRKKHKMGQKRLKKS